MTTETLHLVVDIPHDLMMSSDTTYTLLRDIHDGVEPAQEIDGIHVDEDNADLLLQDYVTAWERAWIRTAETMGYDAIAAAGGSPQAHDHHRRNSDEALSREDTGVNAVEEAWQAVWDACPTVTLAEAVQ